MTWPPRRSVVTVAMEGSRVTASQSRYVPAAGRAAFTSAYDSVLKLTMREGRWRPPLRDRVAAHVPQGGRIVDVGTGTGTLAIAIAAARLDWISRTPAPMPW
jgi:methylase of polypeptide subunit release factors